MSQASQLRPVSQASPLRPMSQASHLTSASWEFESDLVTFHRQAEFQHDGEVIARARSQQDERTHEQHHFVRDLNLERAHKRRESALVKEFQTLELHEKMRLAKDAVEEKLQVQEAHRLAEIRRRQEETRQQKEQRREELGICAEEVEEVTTRPSTVGGLLRLCRGFAKQQQGMERKRQQQDARQRRAAEQEQAKEYVDLQQEIAATRALQLQQRHQLCKAQQQMISAEEQARVQYLLKMKRLAEGQQVEVRHQMISAQQQLRGALKQAQSQLLARPSDQEGLQASQDWSLSSHFGSFMAAQAAPVEAENYEQSLEQFRRLSQVVRGFSKDPNHAATKPSVMEFAEVDDAASIGDPFGSVHSDFSDFQPDAPLLPAEPQVRLALLLDPAPEVALSALPVLGLEGARLHLRPQDPPPVTIAAQEPFLSARRLQSVSEQAKGHRPGQPLSARTARQGDVQSLAALRMLHRTGTLRKRPMPL